VQRYAEASGRRGVERPLNAACDTRGISTCCGSVPACCGWRDGSSRSSRPATSDIVHFMRFTCTRTTATSTGYNPTSFPGRVHSFQRMLSLPLNPRLSDQDVMNVIDAVRDVVARAAPMTRAKRTFDWLGRASAWCCWRHCSRCWRSWSRRKTAGPSFQAGARRYRGRRPYLEVPDDGPGRRVARAAADGGRDPRVTRTGRGCATEAGRAASCQRAVR